MPLKNYVLYGFNFAEEAEELATALARVAVPPRAWITDPGNHATIRRLLPGVQLVERPEGVQPPAWPVQALDPAVVAELAPDETNAFYLVDRSLAYRGRRNHLDTTFHYYRLLQSAVALVDALAPSVVVFSRVPHVAFDFIFYLACRRAGIKTILVNETALAHVLQAVTDIHNPQARVARAAARPSDADRTGLSRRTTDYVARVRSDYSVAEPAYMRAQRRQSASLARRLWSHVARGAARELLRDTDLKIAAQVNRRRTKKLYHRFAPPLPRDPGNYVYFAMHFQPERTSMPEGGLFAQQWLAIQLIACILPDGWSVLVKEHPSTFMMGPSSPLRSEVTYREMSALPRVRLVPTGVPSFQLLDGSRAVATLTGTVGMEALLRGKPVAAFGAARFVGCPGVFHVWDLASCRAFVSAITTPFTVDQQAVERYLVAVEQDRYSEHVEPPGGGRAVAAAGARLVGRLVDSLSDVDELA